LTEKEATKIITGNDGLAQVLIVDDNTFNVYSLSLLVE
jgi:hypothetical protein